MVSQDGQERIISDALALCPSEKLMWSTGTAINQMRTCLTQMELTAARRTLVSGNLYFGSRTDSGRTLQCAR